MVERRIITRTAWGSTGKRGGVRLGGPLHHVIAHTWAMESAHGSNESESKRLMRTIQRSHRSSRGFSDFGYSFAIDTSGRIYEGRGWLRSGAHTVGANRLGHAIGFFGHGDKQPLTDAQWTSARWLIAKGIELGHIDEDYKITGHRDWGAPKTCPGNLVHPHLKKLRGVKVGALETPAPTPVDVPHIPVVAATTVTAGQAKAWATANNADQWFHGYLDALFSAAITSRGIDLAVVAVQAAHETGYGRFGGDVQPEQHNPAGIKTTDGKAFETFPSEVVGAQAQIDHLALYAGAAGAPFYDIGAGPDPRHFGFIAGKADTVALLAGTWAEDPNYGVKLAAKYASLTATPVVTPPRPGRVDPPTPPGSSVPADAIATLRTWLKTYDGHIATHEQWIKGGGG